MIEESIFDYMGKKYETRDDKDNIFGIGISDAEFRDLIIKYLLGDDWYVTDSIGVTQVNEIALYEILSKYSKRFNKEKKIKAKKDKLKERLIERLEKV